MPASASDRAPWFAPHAWAELAQPLGLHPEQAVVLALSGGADSVYLLHVLAAARPAPALRVCHVDHGLRGAESRADAQFCEQLCARLGLPYEGVRIELDPEAPGLEERARRARYRALAATARACGARVLLTAHHQDDRLETLLLRWLRGTHPAGWDGLRTRLVLEAQLDAALEPTQAALELAGRAASAARPDPLVVLRPLLALRRAEIRMRLAAAGHEWREDSSNRDLARARNRVRHGLVPLVEAALGRSAREGLLEFAANAAALESELALRTAPLAWQRAAYAVGEHGSRVGVLPRAALMSLPQPLARRALARLVRERSGSAPGARLLALILADLARGRSLRRSLPGGYTLWLRAHEVLLLPPRAPSAGAPQAWLPFAELAGRLALPPGFSAPLALPGEVALPDGERISARLAPPRASASLPRSHHAVELDADGLDALSVRWPRSGDRFHGLGAPGSKSLRRFLADAGVPRELRARMPLVCSGSDILWVAGLRPCEQRRIRPSTRERLRLELSGPLSAPAAAQLATQLESEVEHERELGLLDLWSGARANARQTD